MVENAAAPSSGSGHRHQRCVCPVRLHRLRPLSLWKHTTEFGFKSAKCLRRHIGLHLSVSYLEPDVARGLEPDHFEHGGQRSDRGLWLDIVWQLYFGCDGAVAKCRFCKHVDDSGDFVRVCHGGRMRD